MSTKHKKSEIIFTSSIIEVSECVVDEFIFNQFAKYPADIMVENYYRNILKFSPIFHKLAVYENDEVLTISVNGKKKKTFNKYFKYLYKNSENNSQDKEINRIKEKVIFNENKFSLIWEKFYRISHWKLIIEDKFELSKFHLNYKTLTLIDGHKIISYLPSYDNNEMSLSIDSPIDRDVIIPIDLNNTLWD
jgi:hypothetical protein